MMQPKRESREEIEERDRRAIERSRQALRDEIAAEKKRQDELEARSEWYKRLGLSAVDAPARPPHR
jgi:hypothetical protein